MPIDAEGKGRSLLSNATWRKVFPLPELEAPDKPQEHARRPHGRDHRCDHRSAAGRRLCHDRGPAAGIRALFRHRAGDDRRPVRFLLSPYLRAHDRHLHRGVHHRQPPCRTLERRVHPDGPHAHVHCRRFPVRAGAFAARRARQFRLPLRGGGLYRRRGTAHRDQPAQQLLRRARRKTTFLHPYLDGPLPQAAGDQPVCGRHRPCHADCRHPLQDLFPPLARHAACHDHRQRARGGTSTARNTGYG